MSKPIAILVTSLLTLSAWAADSAPAQPYATKNLGEELFNKARAENGPDADLEFYATLLSENGIQVFKESVLPSYAKLAGGKHDEFLKSLTPAAASKYEAPEAFEKLAAEFGPKASAGYADLLVASIIEVAASAEGKSSGIFHYYYVMANPNTQKLITFVVDTELQFTEGTVVAGGTVDELITTFLGFDLESAKISSWKKVDGVPDELADLLGLKKEAAPTVPGAAEPQPQKTNIPGAKINIETNSDDAAADFWEAFRQGKAV